MEDTQSRSSIDSSSTGEEYVVVNGEPKLRIPGNGDASELERKMTEVLDDTGLSACEGRTCTDGTELKAGTLQDCKEKKSENVDGIPELKTPDSMRSSISDARTPVGEDDHTQFHGVTYLGSASVNAPRSENEITRNMIILNEQSQMAIPVTLMVPSTSEGICKLLDPGTNSEIASYSISRILFCARGPPETSERMCFAFTCSHGESAETAIFQCHVFRIEKQDAVGKILYSFATAFRRVPRSPSIMSTLSDISQNGDLAFKFSVLLEFREDDGRGNYTVCPKDKNIFKLRKDVEKKLIISVLQTSHHKEIKIERCFGLLISPGRNVKHGDMQLIEMVSMGCGSDGRTYVISGTWDPVDPPFQILNTETSRDTRVFMTVAVDLVLEGIQEPVRFLIETKAKIYPSNERFWYFSKKPHQEQFIVKLKEVEAEKSGEPQFEVVSVESQSVIERKKHGMILSLFPNKPQPPQNVQTPQDADEESENDEPLLSGSGMVSKEVTDDDLLEKWHEVLVKWHTNLSERPRQVHGLCRKGVPEALRGEVWQLLSGVDHNSELLEAYRTLIAKESSSEQVILRDIHRTFPAHEFFKESKDQGGSGQDSLYKISKAYSVYDEEIGYCQGLSFLAAALLLHMPEEQAFAVLVKVMFDYGLRDLFKQGFEELHLKFYQLDRLLQDMLGDVFEHFVELGLETHMFASQWFLTLFTAKFPLFMVFQILDLFLSEGRDTIFNVAIALLKTSRKELLALDFEGVLKYFRVSLPKKYRTEESARELMYTAATTKISGKKLRKYEKEFATLKEQQLQQEDPVERYERENKRLAENNMRLEQENDDMAHELVSKTITLRNDLDSAEEQCELLSKDLVQTKQFLSDADDEKKRLEQESGQLKEMCRRELEKSESENSRNTVIIADYKQICSQLSERLEKQQTANKDEMQRIKTQIQSCDQCGKLISPDGQWKKVEAPTSETELDPQITKRDAQIRELELELAQTKLALVESECKTQDLVHQLNAALSEIQASKNTWFQKTLSSIKEVTVKRENKPESPKVAEG